MWIGYPGSFPWIQLQVQTTWMHNNSSTRVHSDGIALGCRSSRCFGTQIPLGGLIHSKTSGGSELHSPLDDPGPLLGSPSPNPCTPVIFVHSTELTTTHAPDRHAPALICFALLIALCDSLGCPTMPLRLWECECSSRSSTGSAQGWTPSSIRSLP